MTDYSELVKALRYCAESGDFNCNKDCPMYPNYPKCLTKMDMDAAAAIEALIGTVGDLQAIRERLEEENDALRLEPKQGEIVRCGECRYRITAHGISDGWVLCSKPYTERGNAMHRADWFCADGEREAEE